MTKTILIPFSAWDGISKVAAVCGELRRNEMLKGVPDFRTPRDITIAQKGPSAGLDDTVVVKYWVPMGCYATATLKGQDNEAYGMQWSLAELRLRWEDRELGLGWDDRIVRLRLDTEQIKAISLTTYFRRQLGWSHPSHLPQVQEQLAIAEVVSDAIVAALAAPIRAAHERQQARLAEPVVPFPLPPASPSPEWKKGI